MTRNARLEATRPITRGEFLKHSLLVLIVGASCLVRPGRNVRTAHSAESPKPPLTAISLAGAPTLYDPHEGGHLYLISTGDPLPPLPSCR